MRARILLASASVLAVMLATSQEVWAAPTASTTVTVNGTVDQACTLGPWTFTLLSGTGSFDGTDTVSLTLDADADADLDEFAFTLSAPGMCNFTHKLFFRPGATSNGLHRGPAETPPSGFTNHVNYRARLSGWVAFTLETTTNGTPTDVNPQSGSTLNGIQPTNTTMTVTVDQPQVSGGPLLLAGTYTDTIEIQIGNF